MSAEQVIVHKRDLCGVPDVPNDTPRDIVEKNPAHCRCCGSEMIIKECSSTGMQQLDMYLLVCQTCSQVGSLQHS